MSTGHGRGRGEGIYTGLDTESFTVDAGGGDHGFTAGRVGGVYCVTHERRRSLVLGDG